MWTTVQAGRNEIHVIPVNDSGSHALLDYCFCNPKVKKEKNGRVVVHNSFDGREVKEAMERKWTAHNSS